MKEKVGRICNTFSLDTQARFNGPLIKIFRYVRLQQHGLSGVFLSQGPRWKEQRSLLVKTLNLLGLRSCENMITEEVERFCEHLGEKKGNMVQVADLLKNTATNVLWKMTTGKSIKYDDPTFKILW